VWQKLYNIYLRIKHHLFGRPEKFAFSFQWNDTHIAVYEYDREGLYYCNLLEYGYYETCCYVDTIGPVIRRTNFMSPRTPYLETLFFRDVHYQHVSDPFLKEWYESYKMYRFKRELSEALK
jgi:hypothetical protein